ncbi:hypothetical protein [Kordiimonas lipolytica]|uniref:hypothetical protein n=1 Tax=Kordiimonas lipolytica TaxID=1662421 RepID=UPI0018D23413|nr:hypothetical protein [Kordiimonas lipolytica]
MALELPEKACGEEVIHWFHHRAVTPMNEAHLPVMHDEILLQQLPEQHEAPEHVLLPQQKEGRGQERENSVERRPVIFAICDACFRRSATTLGTFWDTSILFPGPIPGSFSGPLHDRMDGVGWKMPRMIRGN